MPRDTYTRIVLVLPVPSEPYHARYVTEILGELVERCGGTTMDDGLSGSWLDAETGELEDAERILIFSDANVETDDPDLLSFLDRLKLRCQQRFDELIIWMTVHRVERITTHDREMS